jgi:hypothetical protein
MASLPGITSGGRCDAADNTDGMAIVSTNDLNRGVARIATDLSAYLLGYYSTNGNPDGRCARSRSQSREGRRVSARRSYPRRTPPTRGPVRGGQISGLGRA